ncbi:RagB/SusD family nutrient uptake outer membrane protein [Rhodohalobacter sp. 8-1]|uniref:RagB/SusD family nutrient uptake outer membrane protein n=1 Tax=Rhodohalobacter sp. 8-1 TaxID=3131972 RepID=UPI0030EE99D2
MNKHIYTKLSLIALMLFMYAACDSVLNLDPLDQPSDAAVWSDPAMSEAFVNDIYSDLAHGYTEVMLGIHTDEAAFTHIGSAEAAQGIINPTNVYNTTWGSAWWTGPPGSGNLQWGNAYGSIRKTNLFFQNFEPELFADQNLASQLTGEVHFLRAMKYHDLLKLHGGVPIVDEVFQLDSDLQVPRDSYEDVLNFILADIEEAENRLDWLPRQAGRASKGAALALKSRVLTYAASDLIHNSQWAGGYNNPELIGLTQSTLTQEDLWERARDAAREIIQNGPYSLYDQDSNPTQNFQNIWLEGGGSEAIFSRFFLEEHDPGGGNWGIVSPGQWFGPNGYFLWGGSTPQQALVDDFETLDGEAFDWSNPDHAEDPFANRDPRMEATVMYNGYQWRERPEGPRATDPLGKIETFLSLRCVGSAECPEERTGLDSRRSPVEDWNGSRTGYILNKFISPNVEHWNNVQEVPWHFFRYAEVLLNYAEAQINLNQEGEARSAINQVRNRAGMPDINDSGQDLVERYRNERRVELAFEDHRYYDVRRWMIAPQTADKDAYGIYLHAQYEYDPNDEFGGMYDYDYVIDPSMDVPTEVELAPGNPNIGVRPVWSRSWNPATYFLPIQRDEMNRNNALVQNPLY